MKNNKCKICKSKSEYLEKHHIIPKSRGGTNDENNLILICSKCHGLAHNVDFSNERGGLIKESIINLDKELKESDNWLDENEHIFFNLMEDLQEKDEIKHSLVLSLLELGKLRSLDIKKWHEIGQLKLKFTMTI